MVLPHINMNLPWVYTCSLSWTLLSPPSLYHLSGSSQCTRPPCSSPTPRVYTNSCPTIASSVVPFSSHLQSFPASGSFQMSQFFTSGGQSIGVSATKSVLPMNIQLISFKMDWLDLLTVQGTLKSLLQHHSWTYKSLKSKNLHGQFSSVAQSSPTLCDPMDCSTPGFTVLHSLPVFAQIYAHWFRYS